MAIGLLCLSVNDMYCHIYLILFKIYFSFLYNATIIWRIKVFITERR